MLEKFFYIIGLLLIIIFVFYLTYVTTRFIGSKAGITKINTKKKHLKIIETMCLGRDKYLYLIKAGNKYILLSSSNKGIETISDIEIEEDAEQRNEADYVERIHAPATFKEVINYYLSKTFYMDDRKEINKEKTGRVENEK
ncbi:MAG TPA: flagellar biosynthetic protein FliO [Clostridiaceae bacterium]|nr:flagellar biosynthetic protein FliO [Clostridiaceae bacterium]